MSDNLKIYLNYFRDNKEKYKDKQIELAIYIMNQMRKGNTKLNYNGENVNSTKIESTYVYLLGDEDYSVVLEKYYNCKSFIHL